MWHPKTDTRTLLENNSTITNYDVVILKLASPLHFEVGKVEPAQLPQPSFDYSVNECFTSGWGLVDDPSQVQDQNKIFRTGKQQQHLKWGKVDMQSKQNCRTKYPTDFNENFMICGASTDVKFCPEICTNQQGGFISIIK